VNLTGVEQAIKGALLQAARRACLSYPFDPDEEDVLRGLFIAGLPALRAGLQTELAGTGLGVDLAGIFCHGNPRVELLEGSQASARCELGDLLVLTRISAGESASNRALLLQTKVPPEEPTPAQHALYRSWPRFRYLRGVERKVTPSQPHPGALFATLRINCADGRPDFGFSTVWPGDMPCAVPLRIELAQLIVGKGGRGFADRAKAREGIDWDAVVWDLIEQTAEAAVRGVRRGWNTSVFMVRTATAMPPSLAQVSDAVPGFSDAWERGIFVGEVEDLGRVPDDSVQLEGERAPSLLEIDVHDEVRHRRG